MNLYPKTFRYPLITLEKTNSTNQYISQLCNQQAEEVAELTTVTAEFQMAGKGQRGNSWEAEEGKNLLFSFVLYPTFLEARRQFILSQIVSLAIKEELSRGRMIYIKWRTTLLREQKNQWYLDRERPRWTSYCTQYCRHRNQHQPRHLPQRCSQPYLFKANHWKRA